MREPAGAKPGPGRGLRSEAPQHSVVTLVGANTAWPQTHHSEALPGRGGASSVPRLSPGPPRFSSVTAPTPLPSLPA